MALKIKKGDTVQVMVGKDAGKRGEVIAVLPSQGKVKVRDANMAIRHTRPRQGQEGGRISKEMPLDMSNVAIIDPVKDQPTRVGFKFLEDGKKVRFAKLSGEVLN